MIYQNILRDCESLESHSRLRYQSAYFRSEAVLCRVLGCYLMYADPWDENITPYLCLGDFWESCIMLAMARLLRPGIFCVGVEANHGYYSLLLADATGACGRALAMEANVETLSIDDAVSDWPRVDLIKIDAEDLLQPIPREALLALGDGPGWWMLCLARN